MLIRPTEDSGFAWVLAEKMRLTASDWASNLDGLVGGVSLRRDHHERRVAWDTYRKSPFRLCSLLSTL